MPKIDNELLKKLSNCIRVLSADAIEKAASGHPGLPLGMADLMTVLAFEFLKFKPNEPKWHERDRLVLSAGHGSMLLYSFYYLAGYKDFSLEDIKNFRQLGSKTAGHPEYGMYEAIETSTGPLGQGLANAVGMAIAAKKACQAHKIYAIVGDGCLMEGIAYEALSLAGHLKLDNLVVIFDDNKISIDGPTSLTISENHTQKMNAFGFNTFDADGHNFDSVRGALSDASSSDKPSFISCKTTIGYGAPSKSGSSAVHGSPLGKVELAGLRSALNWSEEESFKVPEELLNEWRSIGDKNAIEAASKTEQPIALKLAQSQDTPEPTRVSSGRVISYILEHSNNVIVGSADLATSNNMFSSFAKPITKENYSGNFMHYGPREHAMAAIMNGIALSGAKAIGGTFLVFSDYMRPAIRLAAMMKLPVVYVFTHDSIGLGEDGPTHQPVEHLASLRAIPNLLVMRPADYIETVEAWEIAWEKADGPVALALSRQNTPQIRKAEAENLSRKGAYVVKDNADAEITIFASGSELGLAMEVSEKLNIPSRVVSVICMELFETQDAGYKESILRSTKMNIAIEAGISMPWQKYLGENGIFFGVETFGHSAPQGKLYEYFGLTVDKVVGAITKVVIPDLIRDPVINP